MLQSRVYSRNPFAPRKCRDRSPRYLQARRDRVLARFHRAQSAGSAMGRRSIGLAADAGALCSGGVPLGSAIRSRRGGLCGRGSGGISGGRRGNRDVRSTATGGHVSRLVMANHSEQGDGFLSSPTWAASPGRRRCRVPAAAGVSGYTGSVVAGDGRGRRSPGTGRGACGGTGAIGIRVSHMACLLGERCPRPTASRRRRRSRGEREYGLPGAIQDFASSPPGTRRHWMIFPQASCDGRLHTRSETRIGTGRLSRESAVA